MCLILNRSYPLIVWIYTLSDECSLPSGTSDRDDDQKLLFWLLVWSLGVVVGGLGAGEGRVGVASIGTSIVR